MSEILESVNHPRKVVIIGGGPAGLTAASELVKHDISTVVCEKDNIVGGISRTVSYKGYKFDIGGHRFFTKVRAVEDMWHEFMPEDFLLRNRESRIFYNNKFFNYPLKISNALSGLGLITSIQVACSYASIKLLPIKQEKSFEDFVTNRFGRRLFNIFFKTYTEKVWGIPCDKISAEWAAQRIKGLSLVSAINNALLGNRFKSKKTVIKTLIDSFHYPRLGPGMMWEKVQERIVAAGCDVLMETDVTKLHWSEQKGSIISVETELPSGEINKISGTDFISTMPIRELVNKLSPPPPSSVIEAANQLNYRDFITVALIIDREFLFSDNWIYIHDQTVQVGRIQNFKNWSPDMVPDSTKTCLGLEYFCFEGDGLWTMPDQDLIDLGMAEMIKLGFVNEGEVLDGTVVRMPKAYPVYDDTYLDALEKVKTFTKTMLPNLQLVGRNGMHKYNNQDHSMLTAMLAVENIRGKKHDLWQVNAEQEYHEELAENDDTNQEVYDASLIAQTQPLVPRRIAEGVTSDSSVYANLATLDKLCFALACGLMLGLSIFLVTFTLIDYENTPAGQFVALLNNFILGYDISMSGAFRGAIFGFAWGLIAGWLVAYLRNILIAIFIYRSVSRYNANEVRNFLDYM